MVILSNGRLRCVVVRMPMPIESRLVALVLPHELITVTSLRRLHPLVDKEVNVILRHASRDHLSAQPGRQRTDFLSALRFLGTSVA